MELVNGSFCIGKLIWEIFIINRSKMKALCAGNIKVEFEIVNWMFQNQNLIDEQSKNNLYFLVLQKV